MVQTRRSALRLTGCLLIGTIGGCSSRASENNPADSMTSESSPEASPTETPSTEGLPSFTGEILRQASDEAPARVKAILLNDGQSTVEMGFGPTLLYTDNAGGIHDWPQDLVIDPDGYIGPWDDPYQSENGCWRFPEDGQTLVQSSLEWRTLDPGQSVSEEYNIYTRGDSRSCLPKGTYQFQDGGFLEREDQAVIFTLTLEVGDDRQLTAISGDLKRHSP